MLFALIYWLLHRMIGRAGSSKARANDVEIIVLRHQLAVLRRQMSRPRLRRRDRLLMVALSRVLPQVPLVVLLRQAGDAAAVAP